MSSGLRDREFSGYGLMAIGCVMGPLIPLSPLLGVPLSISLITFPLGPLAPMTLGLNPPSHSLISGL